MKPGDIIDDDGNDLSSDKGTSDQRPKAGDFYSTDAFKKFFGAQRHDLGDLLDRIMRDRGQGQFLYEDRVPPYIEMLYSDIRDQFEFRHKLTRETGVLTSEFLHNSNMTPQDAHRRMEQMAALGLSMSQCIKNVTKAAEITNQAIGTMSRHVIMGNAYAPRKNQINTSRAFLAVAAEGYHLRRDEMMEQLDMPFNFSDVLDYVRDFMQDYRKRHNTEHLDPFPGGNAQAEDIADMFVLLLATMFKEVEIAADETF